MIFGDNQTFYEFGKLFTQTSSNISWIDSLQALLVFTVGCVIGRIYDNGHLRFLLSGAFCILFGHMMLHRVVVGIESGFLFVPSLQSCRVLQHPCWLAVAGSRYRRNGQCSSRDHLPSYFHESL
jgi:hypothetical protein